MYSEFKKEPKEISLRDCEAINNFPFKVGDRVKVDKAPELGIGRITAIDLIDSKGNPYYSVEHYGVTTLEVTFSEGEDNGDYILWSDRISKVVD